MDLLDAARPFYKGNLHCHSTLSDGALTPRKVKAFYRERGYDFLAVTDHRLLGEETHMEDGLLVLSGLEMDFTLAGEALHLVGVGMDAAVAEADLLRSPQACIDLMRAHGGRVILAHPAWSLNSLSTVSGLQRLTAAEIYNSVSSYPWSADRADSSHLLDVAFAHGVRLGLVASDDSHAYDGEAGRSFTVVQADALDAPSLLDALDRGRYYASQGPAFRRLSVRDGRIEVECSPVSHILFTSNRPWAMGRCLSGQELTCGAYRVNPDETFVRVQLVDSQGRKAWSHPIWL